MRWHVLPHKVYHKHALVVLVRYIAQYCVGTTVVICGSDCILLGVKFWLAAQHSRRPWFQYRVVCAELSACMISCQVH